MRLDLWTSDSARSFFFFLAAFAGWSSGIGLRIHYFVYLALVGLLRVVTIVNRLISYLSREVLK